MKDFLLQIISLLKADKKQLAPIRVQSEHKKPFPSKNR